MYRCEICGLVFDQPTIKEWSDHRPDCFRERFIEVSCPYCGGPYFNELEDDNNVGGQEND